MNKCKNSFLIFVFSFFLVGITAAPAFAVEPELEDYNALLFAGQDEEVGGIHVWSDTDNIFVKYETIDDWCLTETHLQLAGSKEAFPYAGGKVKNVVPGQFEYSEIHECITEYTYEIPRDAETGTNFVIGAHAVVKYTDPSCYESANMYGILRNTGDVYSIDALNGTSTLLFEMPTPPGANNASPNGLAFNSSNGYLYYTDYQLGTANDTLYFWDGTTQHVAGQITGSVANADFFNGKYYYIPTNTDDLYEVVFYDEGAIAESGNTKLDDIADNSHGWTFDGDIAIKDGVLYGWGKDSHGFEFFTYNLASKDFAILKPEFQQSLQLSFGSDGILYGHRAGTGGYFYQVDLVTGEVEQVPTSPDPSNQYTDTASGEICIPETYTETAWGATEPGVSRFNEKGNWATYFNYAITQYRLVQTLKVYPNGIPVNSDILASDKNYQIRVLGTFTYNAANDWADAEWYWLNGGQVKGDSEGSKPYVLDVSIDGYSSNTDWGLYQDTHTYIKDWPGNDQPVSFSIYDSVYGDNKGFLTIEIYEVLF